MKTLQLRTYLFVKRMLESEHSHDLAEYAVTVALVAFSAISVDHFKGDA